MALADARRHVRIKAGWGIEALKIPDPIYGTFTAITPPIGYAWLYGDYADRIIDWSNAGVWVAGVKGIPTYPVYSTLSASGGDDTSAINAALTACPQGQAVLLNAGTYNTSGAIHIPTKRVLRGAGANLTHILHTGTSEAIEITCNPSGPTHYSVTSGYTTGSTSLGFADGSAFAVGDSCALAEGKPSEVEVKSSSYLNNASYLLTGQKFIVLSKPNANTIAIDRPLHYAYSDGTPIVGRLASANRVTLAGVENLHVKELSTSTGSVDNAIVRLDMVDNCWVKGVWSENPVRYNIKLRGCLACEVRRCLVDGEDSPNHASGNSYGVTLYGGYEGLSSRWDKCTDCLVEDNIAYKCRHSYVFEIAGTGNIFGYNHSRLAYESDGAGPTWLTGDMITHGPHPRLNLIEGNNVQHIDLDYIQGSSNRNALVRNYVRGIDTGVTQHHWGCDCGMSNLYETFIGNAVLNADAVSLGDVTWRFDEQGDGSSPGYDSPPRALNSVLRHGNYQLKEGMVVWDGNIASHAIPSSLYLSSKPSWFGSLPWPTVGPDVSGYVLTYVNPAHHRYDVWDAAGHNFSDVTALFADES